MADFVAFAIPNRYIGASTDTKPTGVGIGSVCYEYDTGKEYITYDGTNWVQYAATTYVGSLLPLADDTYYLGSATAGWVGLHLPDTLIIDDTGVVKFRNNANTADVNISAGDLTLSGGVTALTFSNAATIVAASGLTMPAFTASDDVSFASGKGITFDSYDYKLSDSGLYAGDGSSAWDSRLKRDAAGRWELRNNADDAYIDLALSDLHVYGQLFGKEGYLRVGDAGTTAHGLASEDDLMVTGKLEVSGDAFFDSDVTMSTLVIAAESDVTISSGVIAVSKTLHSVIVEGGVGSGADDLSSATGGTEGQLLILKPAAAYGAKSKAIGEEALPHGLYFKPDGTKVYVTGYNTNTVYQYTLSTPWDVSTATYDSKSKDVSSQDDEVRGLHFKSDGTKMYVLGAQNNNMYQYTLSTPWDVSTATYDSKLKDVSSEDIYPRGCTFAADGSKMYIYGESHKSVQQYTLSTPWDVSTATYDNKSKDCSSEDALGRNLSFKPDGSKMYLAGTANDTVYQYTLSTPWDVSTATYDNVSKDISSEEASITDVVLRSDGARMYIIGFDSDTIYQYTLTTPWDVSTATRTADTVTVVNGYGDGAFILNGGADFVMDSVDDRIVLLHNGIEWVEIARSSGG